MILQSSDAGFYVVVWLIMAFIIIGAVILNIYILYWVYKDANKRDMEGIVWLLVVFFLSLIGLFIYLLVRKPLPSEEKEKPPEVVPPKVEIQPAQPKIEAKKFCPMCGAELPAEAQFCSSCGSKI
jgi:ribosomal protein L40E/H+/Cl- antiporter ClcA